MWYIDGKWYNLKNFKHPGGPVALALAKDRDGTELFHSYHPFSEKAKIMLKKFQVDTAKVQITAVESIEYNKTRNMFEWENESDFARDLKKRAKELFEKTGEKADFTRWILYILVTIPVLLFFVPFIHGNWWMLFLFPASIWLWNAHWFHDASHFSVSKSWKVNHYITYTAPWLTSSIAWYHQHIIGHHNYTNTKYDPDLHHGKFFYKIHPEQKEFLPYFKFQTYYLPAIWMIVSSVLGFVYDSALIITGKYHGCVNMMKISNTEKLLYWTNRLVSAVLIYGWPFLFTDFSLAKCIIFSVVPPIIFSYGFSFSSQLNHLTEQNVGQFSRDWYEHQVLTSHTYSPQSFFWFFVTGGLNLQTEHHLFPGVNQWHLRKLQPIVEQCCKDHDIRYHKSDTAWIALKKHISHVQKLSVLKSH